MKGDVNRHSCVRSCTSKQPVYERNPAPSHASCRATSGREFLFYQGPASKKGAAIAPVICRARIALGFALAQLIYSSAGHMVEPLLVLTIETAVRMPEWIIDVQVHIESRTSRALPVRRLVRSAVWPRSSWRRSC